MLKKTKRKTTLTLTVLFIIILVSSLQVTSAIKPENSSNKHISTKQPVSENQKLKVTEHKITAEELNKLKSQVGVKEEGHNYNKITNGYGTGLAPPTDDEWNELATSTNIIDNVNYLGASSSVDNSATPWFPPIGNQGSQGSCVAWSVGYYVKTFQEAKEHAWNLSGATWIGGYSGHPSPEYQDQIMSPAFTYNLVNGGHDNGINFEDAINLVCFIGVSSWEKMPYNRIDYTTWPSEEAWTQAPLYRGDSGYQVMYLYYSSGISSLKNWLASENLASITVDSTKFSSLTSTDTWTLDNYNNPHTDHAVTVVGYDDNFAYTEAGQQKYGAFKIVNSWGKGFSGEKVPDGFFWISYEAMRQRVRMCNIYYDKINYHPDLTSTFRINHQFRSECSITVGLGTPSSPIITKDFNSYVSGGSLPFCANNIVLDITEFKDYMPSFYNQPFFIRIYDSGTSATGTITYFAIQDSVASGVPLQTRQGSYVDLRVNYSLYSPTLTVSPTSGPPSEALTLKGEGFSADSSVNLSYLNPVTSNWVPLINNLSTTSTYQFTYSFNVPDLMQSNPTGDNSQMSDSIIFKAIDDSNGFSCTTSVPYTEWRRGLTRVGNAYATGLIGNNTDLASTVFVQAGQEFVVSGKWFSPGDLAFLFDGTLSMGLAVADGNGAFDANLILPNSVSARTHNITVSDANTNFVFYVTRLPIISADYDGIWHSSDYTINLQLDGAGVSQIYYRINGASTRSVNVNGPPLITTEGGSNTLEYWGIWSNGLVNVELPHKTLTNIKLDKTKPEGSIQINNGSASTPSTLVTLNITATDSLSGIHQIRFSNDDVWNTEPWETPTSEKNWTLPDSNDEKTVYCQIQDNAGLLTTINSSILLDVTQPMSQPAPEPSNNTSVIPEYSISTIAILFIAATVTLLTLTYTRKNVYNKKFW